MRVAFLLAAAFAVVRADITFCPKHCKCTDEGTSGISAVCSKLDPEEQLFMDPVQHLTIANAANQSFSLTDNIFEKMKLQRLESLKIVNSSLDNISVKAFHQLKTLFDVNLSDNQLFLIHPDTFVNNTNLHRLKLNGNPMQLTQILQSPHETLLRSTSISDLDLSNCQFSQILPKTFSQLKNLVFISLANNLLKNISSEVFDGLAYLEELDLSYNSILKVDKNTFKMNKEMSVLRLRGNPIDSLTGINAPAMEELDLSGCKLHILMKETTEGMPELITLNLSSNAIDVISADAFSGLTELKTLDLSRNNLMGPLPRDLLHQNRELETLSLSGNRDLVSLVDEPGFSGSHIHMTYLELADCGLTSITSGQLTGMKYLNLLNLSSNAIRHLDDSVFAHLVELNTLDLSNNQLTSISTQLLANNHDLVKLILSGNPIKHLPATMFTGLTNLKYLYASNCSLEHLWEGHRQQQQRNSQQVTASTTMATAKKAKLLPTLAIFDISYNHLRNLHLNDFVSMDHLEAIGLSGNPLECDRTTFEVINFLDKNHVDPHRHDLTSSSGDQVNAPQWTELIDSICPVKVGPKVVAEQVPQKLVQMKQPQRPALQPLQVVPSPILQNTRNSFTSVDEIVVETNDSSIMWPMVLAVSILIVALYFIIYLVGEITHRRRSIPAAYARAASLGGHVRTRGASGSPLYYKLYEECSIPAQPTKEKKNYILDFSPIHTILKKNTYKVMKSNGEANV